MKKVFLFSTIFIFGQTLFAQMNLDAIWQNSVVDSYTKYDNYTAEIVTKSTIRGKDTKDRGVVDTLYNRIDTTLIYIEPNKMIGVRSKNNISYTENEVNTTINFQRKFIAINSLQEYWGDYFHLANIRRETHFYASVLGDSPYFKKIDKISDIGNYFVFECIDSSLNINDIQMYEEVKMYVNKDNYLLERVTTKRQNNTIAELELGAIEREIVINYLEFNQPNSIYKSLFNTDAYSNFRTVKNGSPFVANKKAVKKQEREKAKFETSKVTLSKKMLDCEIVGFENNSVKLNDIKGWILFDIWYQSCIPCISMMKEVSLNQQEFKKRGITIVSLNSHEQPSDYLKAFCERLKINISDLYFFKNPDDATIIREQIKIFPSIFLISPDKKVVWQTAGKKSVADLLQEIDKFTKK